MATIYYDQNADLAALKDLTLSVIGYGNQGRAHALNLRDSGCSVIVGAREDSNSRDLAYQDGFQVKSIGEAAAQGDVIGLLLPDEVMPRIVKQQVVPHVKKGSGFLFAHGFTVHHKTIALPADSDILLVAPTGPGRQLRSLYTQGAGLPALVAVEQDSTGKAWQRCLAWARGVGCTRAGAIKTTFAEETITDLFCEQAVLCGGIPELIKQSFETLVSKGYQEELAYISCLKEVKLIADLLFAQGIDGMRRAISNTAKYGSALAGPEIINSATRTELERVLERIESGKFAEAFTEDTKAGSGTIRELLLQEQNSRIARVGRKLKEEISF